MLWLRWLVADAEAYTSSLRRQRAAGKPRQPSRINFHRASRLAPGTRLVVAIARVTIGWSARPGFARSLRAS